VTDVLSFAWQEEWGEKFFLPTTNQDKHLGQVYICFEKIKIQAKEFKVSARNECTRMIVHGLLHLVGYDHMYDKEAKKMFTLQEKIIAAVESKKITPDKEIFLNLV
jgi:probable rRNA maturation factor